MYWMYKKIFISSAVVSVQYLSFFSAAACFWVAYLFVCSEGVLKNKSGTNKSKKIHGCGSGRKCVGYSRFGSELMLNCDIFNWICPAHINFGFLGLLLTDSFMFSWSMRHRQIVFTSAFSFISSTIVTGIVLRQLIV